MATSMSEALVVGEFSFRAFTAITKATAKTAKAEIVGGAVDAVLPVATATIETVTATQYIAEQVFTITRTMTAALATIGYMFSTWIPAIPYMAFLLASLGWLFGLIMTLFAVNIWGVMHLTPARSDSFIGSEQQGYLLLAALFFRPIIAVSALALSYVIAPPIMKLVNMTLLPMMFANNVSTNTISVIFATIFGLVLYFAVVKAVLLMVYMIPQSFPDEVMRIISAGIGDLGQTKGMGTMESSEGTGRIATQSMDAAGTASGEHFKGTIAKHKDGLDAAVKDSQHKQQVDALKGVAESVHGQVGGKTKE
jgi:conjugal transfer/type IV secretion protein DotA/TraY